MVMVDTLANGTETMDGGSGLWGAYRGKRSADAYLGYGYGGYSGEWNGDHGYGGSGLWGAYRGKRSADASYGYGGGYGGYGGYGRGYGGYGGGYGGYGGGYGYGK